MVAVKKARKQRLARAHDASRARGERRALCVRAALTADQRSDLNAARSSEENSSGSSQAAKWPPFSTSLK